VTLTEKEIHTALKSLSGWSLVDSSIEKMYVFDSFRDAIDFVEEAADIAESFDHHPDLDIRYDKVLVRLTTHSLGGLSEKDFRLAKRLDQVEPPEVEEDEEGEILP
jgi:4a-hydroxytetrahydrobiopterin dehydratase